MIAVTRETPTDPLFHLTNVKSMLDDMTRHLREDVSGVDEPKAKALFETTAEVLEGLKKAFEHYEREREEALRSRAARRSASSLRSVSLPDRLSLLGGQGL